MQMRVSAAIVAAAFLATSGCSGNSEREAKPVEAQAAGSLAARPADREEDIRHFLLQEYPDAAPMQYALAWHDLDGDGADEAIVHVVSSYFCGTGGCNTLVLTPAGPMWSKVAEISVSRTPVTVLDSSTNGWKDITVAVGGGGGASGNALLKFDGTAYPDNPTVEPATMTEETGTVLLAEDTELVKLEPEAQSEG